MAQIHCRSELARDGGVSVAINVGGDGLIASRLAPTGFCGEHWICGWQKSSVGASLLAMAVCQSPWVLDVSTHSRVSPLPQGFSVNTRCAESLAPNQPEFLIRQPFLTSAGLTP
ncbi:hypothetical protein D3C71_1323570 [compost metagenome]